MLPRVTATAFQRELSSGTTKPCLLLCNADDGSNSEYVTKFRSTVRNQEAGLCFESFAVLLDRICEHIRLASAEADDFAMALRVVLR
jgi:hypothetical protein